MMLTDTGTTITYLVKEDFDKLMPLICPNCTLNTAVGMYELSTCTQADINTFAPLWFKLDNYYYEMPVSSYLQVVPSALSYPQCYIKIAQQTSNNDFGTLGITFLQNFVQYYSLTHNQQAFMPSEQSTAKVVYSDIDESAILMSSIGCALVFIILGFVASE